MSTKQTPKFEKLDDAALDRVQGGGFSPYGTNFTGGVYVGSGDVTGDGTADVIVGAGAGGGPHVKVFDGR